MRAARESVSLEEAVRRILRPAVADEESFGRTMRRIVCGDAFDLDLPRREMDAPIDFFGDRSW